MQFLLACHFRQGMPQMQQGGKQSPKSTKLQIFEQNAKSVIFSHIRNTN